ncbi:MAG: Polyketide cyclase/dehydrase [Acidimicrobiia bacterium]|nr:Polyketide cyclase/dehydrase [Acidimicrobiia bacterium]
MATARVCKVVELPALPLFQALADWGGWGSWLPGIEHSELASGGPGTVGSVRVLGAGAGAPVRERLTACDEATMSVAYTIDGPAPFPARRYEARVSLLPLSDRVATVIDWSASFDADADVEAELRSTLESYFGVFIDAVAAHVGP